MHGKEGKGKAPSDGAKGQKPCIPCGAGGLAERVREKKEVG